MRKVPRHLFVEEALKPSAYEDHALPIGQGQTISQPYVGAWMTELLPVSEGMKVLEIGTGSGYQAAILAEIGAEVYTMERMPELLEKAQSRLMGQGYGHIHFKLDDGTLGWPEFAPYDAISVTACTLDDSRYPCFISAVPTVGVFRGSVGTNSPPPAFVSAYGFGKSNWARVPVTTPSTVTVPTT